MFYVIQKQFQLLMISKGDFQEVIDDIACKKNVDTVVLCSGKFYYDMKEKQKKEV